MSYPCFTLSFSGVLHPVWLRGAAGKRVRVRIGPAGQVPFEGQILFVRPEDRAELPEGCEVEVWLGRHFTCAKTADIDAWLQLDEVRRQAAAAKTRAILNQRRDAARAQFATWDIPVPWRSAIKDVLSGLSESSDGSGTNARTVVHIELLADLDTPRLKRKAGSFLCTSAAGSDGKRWSAQTEHRLSDGDGGSYPAEATCRQCLKLAERWRRG